MAPRNTGRPKGAYPKVGGVGGIKFTGSTPMDKFQNFLVSTAETTELRKERFENPSRLYAAARKLGIPESKVKKQIDELAKFQAKYGAKAEKKSEDLSMQDMVRRSKANAAAKKKAVAKKATSIKPLKQSSDKAAKRGLAKGKPIKPMIKKLKDSSDKATKKKR